MAGYTKLDLLNDISALVERYIEQELAAAAALNAPNTDEVEIEVEQDDQGHYVDTKTGDIWNLDAQKIVGRKDLATGKCSCHPEHETITEASLAKLLSVASVASKQEELKEELLAVEPKEEPKPLAEELKPLVESLAEEPKQEEPKTVAKEPVKKRTRKTKS